MVIHVLGMCDEVMSSKEKPKLNVQWSVEGERTSKLKCDKEHTQYHIMTVMIIGTWCMLLYTLQNCLFLKAKSIAPITTH